MGFFHDFRPHGITEDELHVDPQYLDAYRAWRDRRHQITNNLPIRAITYTEPRNHPHIHPPRPAPPPAPQAVASTQTSESAAPSQASLPRDVPLGATITDESKEDVFWDDTPVDPTASSSSAAYNQPSQAAQEESQRPQSSALVRSTTPQPRAQPAGPSSGCRGPTSILHLRLPQQCRPPPSHRRYISYALGCHCLARGDLPRLLQRCATCQCSVCATAWTQPS